MTRARDSAESMKTDNDPHEGTYVPLSRTTPINSAEAIVDPLWDPSRSGLAQWEREAAADSGVTLRQEWCKAAFEWVRAAPGEPVLRLRRYCALDCRDYDRLVVSAVLPPQTRLCMRVRTERGECLAEHCAPDALATEYAVALDGAERVLAIELAFRAAERGPAGGWLNWLLLQSAERLPQHLLQYAGPDDERWEGDLQPESYVPRYEPLHGYAIDATDVAALRGRIDGRHGRHADGWHEQCAAGNGKAGPVRTTRQPPASDRAQSCAASHAAEDALEGNAAAENRPLPGFIERARAWAEQPPERWIGEFVNFWDDTRFCRARDRGRWLVGRAPELAEAGLVLRDERLLRMAARYALSLARCAHWHDGMMCTLPGGLFEHRCFVQSLVVYDLAYTLDAAGELLTERGRAYLRRRIAEEGLAAINATSWRHEYIHHCNQLLWFSAGRLLGYAALLPTMPRVRPYMELALEEMRGSLASSILPDGGYVEGPIYFLWTVKRYAHAIEAYARATGADPMALLPERLKATAAYAELLVSTAEDGELIPICDAVPTDDDWRAYDDALAFLARTLPDSLWPQISAKHRRRSGGRGQTFLAAALQARLAPARVPAPRPFVQLPEMGWMASTRQHGAHAVKLLIAGNRAGAGHCHEDKGSFVLEYAGETFAEDPGSCDYGLPLAAELQQCQRHNMLVPLLPGERPRPSNPLPADIRPAGTGDARQLHIQAELTPGWEGYYASWTRSWRSEEPGLLTIRDEYALAQGDAVDFYWQTRRRVTRQPDGRILLTGTRGRVALRVPEDCAVRIEELPVPGGTIRRIALRREGRTGTLIVEAELSALTEGEGGDRT
ncbi:heparinase II/III family protein [Paenibacillus sp. IB182496]|uniref:Heparinase II/III family protein n=1 Tax=Paenibacillus sabuli TaxID=2772509 RepID=A0A927BQH8_9BACL|nr:heparinase II/III family protein [Paenibacillus sabuli]MBD2843699.1 heparinase II/III family protein [Paenibacillus sabuli]